MLGKFGSFEFPLSDRYRFEEELGHGGMGAVFRAHDLRLDCAVAIKVLHPALTNEVGSARFRSEILIAAKLQHPKIVRIRDCGEVDGRLYYVMDYCPGETLRGRIDRERQLPVDEVLRIARDVSDALQYAHDHQVVHRDVKPENILITEHGARLLDFGLARALNEVDTRRLTASGMAVGTPHYLSPEQAAAERDVGPKADQYALACVIYETLVGEPPFTGPTASAIAMRHLSEPPPKLASRRRSVDARLESAVLRAMEKVPADRFPSVRAFVEAAGGDESPRIASPNNGGVRHSARFKKRSWFALSLGVSIAAATVVSIGSRYGLRAPRDVQSVLIFPLHASGNPSDVGDVGQSASLLLAYRLEGTPGIRFFNAADYLIGDERSGRADITLDHKRSLARSLNADRVIDGWIQQHDDSVTVVLRLESVDGGTPAIQNGVTAKARTADAPRLALAALRSLVPAFIDARMRYDPTALEQRDPAAIIAFLEGERAYRESHFEVAVDRYHQATDRDSLLAVAALKAAQAESWLTNTAEAREYADAAMRHVDLLPRRYATYATALQYYLAGDGDSTIAIARGLVASDPRWTDAWFLIGEAYLHLLPSTDALSQVRLADSAFRMAARADSAFSPAREHLLDLALRHGDARQIDSLAPLVLQHLDEGTERWLNALVQCVRVGPATVDWQQLRTSTPSAAWRWAEMLVFEPGRLHCARSAFDVTLARSDADRSTRWGAVVGTNALMMAAGNDAAAAHFLASPVADKVRGWALLFPDAAAGAADEQATRRKADSIGTNFAKVLTPHLWLLTTWYSVREDSAALRSIASTMTARRDSSHSHLDSLVAAVAGAHALAARHDTAAALVALQHLRSVAPYQDLMWQPWEAFAGEHMLEARLLAGQGRKADAIAAAARIDVQVPMNNLVYLRQSLRLREQWARELGDTASAAVYRQRLADWSAGSR